jgi:hypothetical protein
MRRRYRYALLAGFVMFAVVHLIDALLAKMSLHAEATYIDDVLLGALTGGLVFFLQQRHERELRKHLECEAMISEMNHHIRNALQVIVCRTSPDAQDREDLEPLQGAVNRIDWALREILPIAVKDPDDEPAQVSKPPSLASGK